MNDPFFWTLFIYGKDVNALHLWSCILEPCDADELVIMFGEFHLHDT